MKKYFHQTGLFLLLISFIGCTEHSGETAYFSSDQDTLIIATKLHKGAGQFERIFAPLRFKEISDLSYPLKLPTNLTDIKHTFKIVDYDAGWYKRHRNDEGLELPPFIIEAISDNTLDTTQLPTEEQNRIDIITGIRDSVQVFVLDENNNQDLTDDPVRVYQPMNWQSNENLIKSIFHRYNGDKIVEDSTWVKVGTLGANPMLFLGVAQYVTADFYLDGQFYQLGAEDFQTSYTYLEPTFALLTGKSVVKDSVQLKDILSPNEFVRLNTHYYRIDKVSRHGDFITLIKEHDFSAQTGTQVGIKAPAFTAISTTGDTIVSSNMHDKPLLIANSCGCGGDMRSLEVYDEMIRQYGKQAYMINIDTGRRGLDQEEGIYIDMEDEDNMDLVNNFRSEYCSRICYLIDVNNTVVGKFNVIDWRDELPIFLDS
jgi:hypothetical protein